MICPVTYLGTFGLQETSANTLGFGVLYLLLDQEVQRKLQAEIDAVVPRGELVTLAHRSKLPYTLAVINVSGI